MTLENSLGSLTTKVSPFGPQQNICGYAHSSSMLMNSGKLDLAHSGTLGDHVILPKQLLYKVWYAALVVSLFMRWSSKTIVFIVGYTRLQRRMGFLHIYHIGAG